MTKSDLDLVRKMFDTWLKEAMKPELLPYDEYEFAQYMKKNPKRPSEYFRTHRLPDEVKYA
jgi:hypothetical protein